jgi:hypothetical protein
MAKPGGLGVCLGGHHINRKVGETGSGILRFEFTRTVNRRITA